MAKSKLSPEDLRLWRAQMRGVKPLSKEEPEGTQLATEKTPDQHPQQSQPLIKEPKAQKRVPSPHPFSRQDLRRLKIDGHIDLHGMTLEKAHQALHLFLHKAQEKGLKVVLVITGKGSISSERTLRHQLPQWVKESPLRPLVSSFHHPAKQRDGGAGAFYLGVRRKKS